MTEKLHIRGEDWDADAANRSERLAGEATVDGGLGSEEGGKTFAPFPRRGKKTDRILASMVYVRNDTGADVGRYAVLGLDALRDDPATETQQFKATYVFKGVAPATGTHDDKFAITAEDIPAGKVGRAVSAGTVPVQVDVSDTSHTRADIKDATTTELQSSSAGEAFIVDRESGTGVVWAVVTLGKGSPGDVRWWKITAVDTTDGSHDADEAEADNGTLTVKSPTNSITNLFHANQQFTETAPDGGTHTTAVVAPGVFVRARKGADGNWWMDANAGVVKNPVDMAANRPADKASVDPNDDADGLGSDPDECTCSVSSTIVPWDRALRSTDGSGNDQFGLRYAQLMDYVEKSGCGGTGEFRRVQNVLLDDLGQEVSRSEPYDCLRHMLASCA